MLGVSLLPPTLIRRLAVLGLTASLVLMMLVPFFGESTKGAHRWISLLGISVQPSEFMKPSFAVVMAWICVYILTPSGMAGITTSCEVVVEETATNACAAR